MWNINIDEFSFRYTHIHAWEMLMSLHDFYYLKKVVLKCRLKMLSAMTEVCGVVGTLLFGSSVSLLVLLLGLACTLSSSRSYLFAANCHFSNSEVSVARFPFSALTSWSRSAAVFSIVRRNTCTSSWAVRASCRKLKIERSFWSLRFSISSCSFWSWAECTCRHKANGIIHCLVNIT